MKTKLFAPTLFILFSAGMTLAQRETKPPAKPPEKVVKGGDVILRSQGGTHDDVKGISRLTGNVTVRQDGEDFVLYADTLTYDRNLNQAVATGNLKLETTESTITGNALRANFDAKQIVITGKVTMNSHGKEDGVKKPPATNKPGDEIGRASCRERV